MKITCLILALAALGTLAAAAPAMAAERESPYDRIKNAVTRPLYPVEGTHVLSLGLGVSFGQEYTRDLLFGLSYRYHFSPYLGAGLTVLGGLAFESGLVGEIRAANAAAINGIRPETGMMAFSADFHVVPIYGKFVVFGKHAFHYALTVSVGVGGVLAKGKKLDGQADRVPGTNEAMEREGGFRVAPFWALGLRILFTPKVGLTLELRDYIWQETIATSSKGEQGWGNHFALTIGPSFRF